MLGNVVKLQLQAEGQQPYVGYGFLKGLWLWRDQPYIRVQYMAPTSIDLPKDAIAHRAEPDPNAMPELMVTNRVGDLNLNALLGPVFIEGGPLLGQLFQENIGSETEGSASAPATSARPAARTATRRRVPADANCASVPEDRPPRDAPRRSRDPDAGASAASGATNSVRQPACAPAVAPPVALAPAPAPARPPVPVSQRPAAAATPAQQSPPPGAADRLARRSQGCGRRGGRYAAAAIAWRCTPPAVQLPSGTEEAAVLVTASGGWNDGGGGTAPPSRPARPSSSPRCPPS